MLLHIHPSPECSNDLLHLSLLISPCLASVLAGAASAVPKLCPAGTFSSLQGRRMLSECQPCPSGFYCEEPGLTAPTGECWEGKSWINRLRASGHMLKGKCVCVYWTGSNECVSQWFREEKPKVEKPFPCWEICQESRRCCQLCRHPENRSSVFTVSSWYSMHHTRDGCLLLTPELSYGCKLRGLLPILVVSLS